MNVLLPAAAFIISLLVTRHLCNPRSRFHILDRPNDRSLHKLPTPRSGGLAILLAIYVCGIAMHYWLGPLLEDVHLWIGGSCLLVAGVSYYDDRYSIPPSLRLIVHILAAFVIVIGGLVLRRLDLPGVDLSLPYWAGAVLAVLFLVWMLNLYNFMDGMDGFAGGMAISGFGTFALLGWISGAESFTTINLIVTAGVLGFLLFNFPPARIFMGDVGASLLGLLAASFSLWGVQDGVFPFWAALLIFSPFIVDATTTLFRRLLEGKKIWEPHKIHYYQRLVQAGWGHRKTVLVEYVIMISCGISALISVRATVVVQISMLLGWAFFYSIFFLWISWYTSKQRCDAA